MRHNNQSISKHTLHLFQKMQNIMKEAKSCYKGAYQESWNAATSDLIYFIQEILPRVTIKDPFNVTMIHPDFPAIQHSPVGEEIFEYRRISDQISSAVDFLNSEPNRIVMADANEREAFVLSKLSSVKKLLLILTKRIEAYSKYVATFADSRNLGEVAYSGDTALATLLHLGTKDQSLKSTVVEKILNQYKKFNILKDKLKSTAAVFNHASSKLAEAENLIYNEHFNNNSFLNYHKYRNEISGFLNFQSILWGEMISYLNAANLSEVKPFVLKTTQAHIRQANMDDQRGNALLPTNIAVADIANINIITHNLARKAGCTGQPAQIRFSAVYGGEDQVATTMVYNLEVITPGNSIYIQAYGTETPICRSKKSNDEWIQSKATKLNLSPNQILNEEMTVELLIGTRNVSARHQSNLLSTGLLERVIIISPDEFEGGSPIHYFNLENSKTIR